MNFPVPAASSHTRRPGPRSSSVDEPLERVARISRARRLVVARITESPRPQLRGPRPRTYWRAAQDHAGGEGVVRRFVDEDERAGAAVAAVLVEEQRLRGAQRDAADLVERRATSPSSSRCSVFTSSRYCRSFTSARAHFDVCLIAYFDPASSLLRSLNQQTIASMSWPTCGPVVRPADHVAPADVEVVLEPDRDRHRRRRLLDRAVGGRRSTAIVDVNPDGSTTTSSPRLYVPLDDLARVAAVVVEAVVARVG